MRSRATPPPCPRRGWKFASTSTCVPAIAHRRLLSTRHVDRRRLRARPRPSRLPQESKHLGPEDALEKIKEGVEAESFIRLHVVQAVGNERGNYEMRIESQHVDGEYEAPGRAGGCAGEDGKKNA